MRDLAFLKVAPMNKQPATAQAPAQTGMSATIWLLLILLSVIWGGSFLFGRIAVLEIPPLVVVLARVALAALAIWLFIAITGRKIALSRWFVINIAGMAILNNVIPFTCILYGQTEIGSGLASLVNAMTPIWTVIIANFLTADEKLSKRKMLGIAAGFAGAAILIGADALRGLNASALAQATALLATISYGFAGVYGKRFRQQDPIVTAAGQLTFSTIFMALIVLATGTASNLEMPSTLAIWSVIGLAIPCTAFAYVLFFTILQKSGATNASLVTFLVPLSAIALGILFLGEQLEVSHIAGMLVIGTGLIILDGRFFREKIN